MVMGLYCFFRWPKSLVSRSVVHWKKRTATKFGNSVGISCVDLMEIHFKYSTTSFIFAKQLIKKSRSMELNQHLELNLRSQRQLLRHLLQHRKYPFYHQTSPIFDTNGCLGLPRRWLKDFAKTQEWNLSGVKCVWSKPMETMSKRVRHLCPWKLRERSLLITLHLNFIHN